MRKRQSSPSAIWKRLDRLEKAIRDSVGATDETEDLREVEISVYGQSAVAEIEEREGRGALLELLHSSETPEEIKEQITAYCGNKMKEEIT